MKKLILMLVSILSLGLVSAQQNSGAYGCPGWGMMSGAYGYGSGFIFGWIFMVLVVELPAGLSAFVITLNPLLPAGISLSGIFFSVILSLEIFF